MGIFLLYCDFCYSLMQAARAWVRCFFYVLQANNIQPGEYELPDDLVLQMKKVTRASYKFADLLTNIGLKDFEDDGPAASLSDQEAAALADAAIQELDAAPGEEVDPWSEDGAWIFNHMNKMLWSNFVSESRRYVQFGREMAKIS